LLVVGTPASRQWTRRYALLAYGASWIVAGLGSLVTSLLFGFGAGALWFDAAWLASLVSLYRAGVLRAADLVLRRSPAARSIGLALLVFAASTVEVCGGEWEGCPGSCA